MQWKTFFKLNRKETFFYVLACLISFIIFLYYNLTDIITDIYDILLSF